MLRPCLNLTEPRRLGFQNKVRCGFASWLQPDLNRRTGRRWSVQLVAIVSCARELLHVLVIPDREAMTDCRVSALFLVSRVVTNEVIERRDG